MGGNDGGLEEFQPIFRQVKPEWSNQQRNQSSNHLTPKPFIFHVRNSKLENGNSSICICLTDFDTNTFQAMRSVLQLEDMRCVAGIGGPWTDFVDYMRGSFTSEDLKLVLEGQSKSGGAISARVIAQKSDGMPTISISLTKIVDAAARDSIANFTLELFKLYKTEHELLINEQQSRFQLAYITAAEKERRAVVQGQPVATLASRALTSVSRQEKKHIVQRVQDASPASQALTSVSCQEKNHIAKREQDSLPASQALSSRALTSVSRQEKNHIIQTEQDASTASWALVPVSRKKNNDSIQRELDTSASRPQKYRKIADLSASDAISPKFSGKQRAKVTPSSKVTNRVVPAYRRVKVQGTVLVESDDECA